MARKFIGKKGIDPATTIFIGDTLHDSEVAETLGIQCLLVAGGHQSEARLSNSGCQVVKGLSDVIELFN
jgi:phosphoglycolate phosphatase